MGEKGRRKGLKGRLEKRCLRVDRKGRRKGYEERVKQSKQREKEIAEGKGKGV